VPDARPAGVREIGRRIVLSRRRGDLRSTHGHQEGRSMSSSPSLHNPSRLFSTVPNTFARRDPWLTTDEAAKYLDVTRWTIHRYVRDGRLAAEPTYSGQQLLFRLSAIDAIDAQRKATRLYAVPLRTRHVPGGGAQQLALFQPARSMLFVPVPANKPATTVARRTRF
jgi:excisionase family DNA binding protein